MAAHKIEITVQYKIGYEVCRKCDPDKLKYIIIGYVIDRKDIMYQIRGSEGLFTLYSFELIDYKDYLSLLN